MSTRFVRLRRTLLPAFTTLAAVTAALVAVLGGDGTSSGAAITPNDPRWSSQWNLPHVRADHAWSVIQGSSAVRIALLDTGVGYFGIPADLQGNVGPEYDTFTGQARAVDDYGTYGSGTSNAGIIAARGNNGADMAGTSWFVTLLPVKVCNWSGSCPHSNIAAGIDWALAQNAHIIQITPAMGTSSQVLDDAVARAVAAGKIVVAPVAEPAVGGGYPASLAGVIGVGATTSTDEQATFSASSTAVDISAPGQSVLTLASGGCCVTRSSVGLAASHVTGALALLMAAGVPAGEAPQRLYEGATDLGAAGRDNAFGWGRLDICAALDRAGRPCSAPPTPTPTPTATNTAVPPTATATSTRTNTPVPPTATNTPVPPTATASPTRTNTPVPPTATATPTRTNTPIPPTATNTPIPPTATPTRTNTPAPATATATGTPTRTSTPQATPTCVKKGKRPRC